jgi:two-component system, NarL family, sensor histidine kinase UhpB
VAELKRLVNQAMDELLNLARQLRPSALDDHGLVPAIETQLKRFGARTGIEVRLDTRGDPDVLPEVVQTAIYRVAQEALTNVARHAHATRVELQLARNGTQTTLTVRDDGVGLSPGALPSSHGIRGMRERAMLLGAQLVISSKRGRGTEVSLSIPIDPEAP